MPNLPSQFTATPSSREETTGRNRIYGTYPGVVEYNLDPLHIGRVKVRVPLFHQTEKSIKTKDLPWALPIHSMGGAYDVGSFNVPPTGTTVFVTFMAGDPEQPLYFGGWFKNPTQPRAINFKVDKEDGNLIPDRDRFPITAGYWFQPIGPEVPSEIGAVPYHDPTVRVLLKSVKGHTFIVEDRDGFESLDVIDRAGQQLTMNAPVTKEKNDVNQAQRIRKEARDGDGVGYDDLQGGGSTLELVGTSGQRLRMSVGKDAEFVEIVSQNARDFDSPPEEKSEVKLTLAAGLGVIDFAGVYKGEETFRLQVETATGQVTVKAQGGVSLSTEFLSILSNLIMLRGNVHVDGDLAVNGDALVSGRVIGRAGE